MGQKKSKEVEELLEVHGKRRRSVIGCMKCAKELLPLVDETISSGWGYLCGTCREGFWMCPKCVHTELKREEGSFFEHKPGHRLFKEPVDLLVDVSSITEASNPRNGYCTAEAVRACFQTYRRRWLIGERIGLTENFRWETYDVVHDEATSAFYGCRKLFGIKSNVTGEEIESDNNKEDISFCMLVGASSRLWYLSYFCCILFGVRIVPMVGSSTVEQIAYIAEKVKPKVIFISKHIDLPKNSQHVNNSGIVILHDSELRYQHIIRKKEEANKLLIGEGSRKEEESKKISWSEVVEVGKKERKLWESIAKRTTVERRDVSKEVRILLPSSGTTGLPKLIILTDEMIKSNCTPPSQGLTPIMLSIEPLRQVFDLIAKGGRFGIFTSISRISSDLKIVRPTIFGSTPAFFLSLYENFKIELKDKLAKKEPNPAILESKNEELIQDTTERIRRKLCRELVNRNLLGNRCRVVIIGGAVSSKELRTFVFDACGCVVIDGYGSSETGAISSSGRVLQDVKVILIDSPDYGYFTSDQPFPRGEIVVNSPRMTQGYYGDEEATAAQFIIIGGIRYSRTGDIGKMENGKVEVIDRVKSLFKLRNGVFVAPSPLECVFENSSLVSRVLIWGSSSMSCVVASVVVKEEEIEGEEEEEEENCQKEDLLVRIKSDFSRLAKLNGLKPMHVPKAIVIDHEEWSVENGLLNSAGKPVRASLLRKYRDEMIRISNVSSNEECKRELHVEDVDAYKNLIDPNSNLLQGLVKLVIDSIPEFDPMMIPKGKFSEDISLFDLGANSLAYARIVSLIRRRFNSKLTFPELMGCENLGDVQRAMFGDTSVNEKSSRSSVEFWEDEVKRGLEYLESICKDVEIDENKKSEGKEKVVLLTGGRGFVGIFLLSELCSRGVKVICLLRKNEKCSGHLSISAKLKNFELRKCTEKEELEILEGDVSKIDFGIKIDKIGDICQNLGGANYPDVILHCASAVGSSVPYSVLKPHNVNSLVHGLSLAKKMGSRFVHVSTVGFLPGGLKDPSQENISPEGLSFLGSYAQSKWVSERILLTNSVLARDRVSVVRVGTCFGSKLGVANEKDSVIRLIAGLAEERCYCFGKESPLPSMFRLAPVDWVAKKIVGDHLGYFFDETRKPQKRVTCAMTLRRTLLSEVIEALEKCGVKMEKVSSLEFRKKMEKILEDSNEEHPLFVYASTLASSGFGSDNDISSGVQEDEDEDNNNVAPQANIVGVIKWMIKMKFIN